jgi:hypothetical protein
MWKRGQGVQAPIYQCPSSLWAGTSRHQGQRAAVAVPSPPPDAPGCQARPGCPGPVL